jgi:curved DNA-binding protein
MSYYETLDVPRTSTPEEIKKSYRSLVKKHHPDLNGGDDTLFKKIAEAYEVLSDSSARKQYDIKTSPQRNYNSYFNGSAANSSADFSEMFDKMFNQQAKGSDIRVSINLTFEEVYSGTRRYIDIGAGGFNVDIPKGITNGAKLRVREKGQPHQYNSSAKNGDVIIQINVLHDLDLIVNGEDIFVDLNLHWYDLLLGGEFEIKTKVHSVKIKVPQGSFDSKILRVVGKGMPIYNTEGYGNLMVKLRTKNINLTPIQIDLLKNIKEYNGGF